MSFNTLVEADCFKRIDIVSHGTHFCVVGVLRESGLFFHLFKARGGYARYKTRNAAVNAALRVGATTLHFRVAEEGDFPREEIPEELPLE